MQLSTKIEEVGLEYEYSLKLLQFYDSGFQPFSRRGTSGTLMIIMHSLSIKNIVIKNSFREIGKHWRNSGWKTLVYAMTELRGGGGRGMSPPLETNTRPLFHLWTSQLQIQTRSSIAHSLSLILSLMFSLSLSLSRFLFLSLSLTVSLLSFSVSFFLSLFLYFFF